MKKLTEKISILLLSFMLISAFSITSSLPAMKDFFKDYSVSQVELLVSLPSFGVLLMLLLTGLVEKYLSERVMIAGGLVLLSFSGVVPFFVGDYWLIFISRLGLGLGTGMINAKAISIISERYKGRERVQMMGMRGATEVVGSAILTLVVGQLLFFSWQATFLIYSFGLVILSLYLFFVPYNQNYKIERENEQSEKPLSTLTSWQKKYSFTLAIISCAIICINTAISLRIPEMVIEKGIGTASTASFILSMMQLIGIWAGFSFSSLFHMFQKNLLTVACLFFAFAQILLGLSNNFWFLMIAVLIAGFSYSIALTTIFNAMADRIPGQLLNKVTSYVLIGCNLGGAVSPMLLTAIESINRSFFFVFLCFGLMMLVVSVLAYLLKKSIVR